MKNILKYNDGYQEESIELNTPQRLAQPGDVYQVVSLFYTKADKQYEPGDKLTILNRTQHSPHNLSSSLGNLVIKNKYFTSTWTCFDDIIAQGLVKLV